DPEFAEKAARPPTAPAAIAVPDLKLRLLQVLCNFGGCCHVLCFLLRPLTAGTAFPWPSAAPVLPHRCGQSSLSKYSCLWSSRLWRSRFPERSTDRGCPAYNCRAHQKISTTRPGNRGRAAAPCSPAGRKTRT